MAGAEDAAQSKGHTKRRRPWRSTRIDAERSLARALLQCKESRPVVLGLPRGGVPVAAVMADALHAPLDLLLARKIGTPMQPGLAMGAVVDGSEPLVLRNEDAVRYARATTWTSAPSRAPIWLRSSAAVRAISRDSPAGRIVIGDGIATWAVRVSLRARDSRQG